MDNKHRRLRLITAMTGLIFAGGGQAADRVDSDLERLMPLSLADLIRVPVITASRQPETRDRTPAHIVVITREQIRERRYKNLADLLEDMPGVDFMRGTKSSAFNNFAFQGYAGPNKLLIMLDGVRINHPAGGSIPLADNYALYHARQVEILYGPAAALYGADAVAGVVNIITDRGGEGQGTWGSIGGGNFGARETSFMAGMKGEGPLSFNVGGHWQQADRAPLQNYYPAEFASKDARTMAGNLVTPAANRENYQGEMASRSFYARVDVGQDVNFGFYRNVFRSLTSTGDPPVTAIYRPDATWTTQIDTLYGKWRFDLGSRISGEMVVDYSSLEVDPQSKYFNIYNNFTNGYSYVRGRRFSIEQNFNWTLSERHRVQAGLGYQRYEAIETSSLPAPYNTGRAPGNQGFTYLNTNLPLMIYDAHYNNVSGYAQLQSDWNERFTTMVGVRIDRHSDYGRSVNPRLGGVWRVDDEQVLKLLYGQAFRAPSPEEYLSFIGAFDGSKNAAGQYVGTGFRVPNFGLQPEKARTLSLTWDWRPRQDVNLVANAYRSEIRNLVVTLPSSAVDFIPGAILVAPESKGNAGKQTLNGLDLMAQWRFKMGSAWTGDLWGSASWVGGRINEGDGVQWDIPYIADRKFKIGSTLRYLDRVTITPQVFWIGDTTNGRKLDSRNPPYRRQTPGYTVANLHVGWHKLVDGHATLWFDIYNLFDKRYYAAHGSSSRTFYDMPQQPRTWMLSLEYRF